MGSEAVKLVEKTETYELVAVVDHRYGGKLLNELEGISSLPVPIYNDGRVFVSCSCRCSH